MPREGHRAGGGGGGGARAGPALALRQREAQAVVMLPPGRRPPRAPPARAGRRIHDLKPLLESWSLTLNRFGARSLRARRSVGTAEVPNHWRLKVTQWLEISSVARRRVFRVSVIGHSVCSLGEVDIGVL